MDVDVKEEHFIAVNEEVDLGIKQETPGDITFPDINAEPDEVSCVCICLLLDTFYQCPEMSVVFVTSTVLANWNVLDGLDCMQFAEKRKIYILNSM